MSEEQDQTLTRAEVLDALVLADRAHTIIVWEWRNAPEVFRNLSRHGGDEDWVAFVPKGMWAPLWASEGSSFGRCSVSEHEVPTGTVLIGAHA